MAATSSSGPKALACALVGAGLLLGCSDKVPTTNNDPVPELTAGIAGREKLVNVNPGTRSALLKVGSTTLTDSANLTFKSGNAAWLSWTASNKRPWLKLESTRGKGPRTLRWKLAATGLLAGTYVDTIWVSSHGQFGWLIDTLVIHAGSTVGATLTVAPKHAETIAKTGSTVPVAGSGALTLSGATAPTTPWRATNKQPWLKIKTPSGVGSSSAFQWSRDPSGLTVGVYVDTITIETVSGPTAGSATIIDTLRIVPGATDGGATLGAGKADSPTGRRPRLIWTAERQFVWNRMRADNLPWYRLLKDNADRTGTGAERYGDDGAWAATMFQVTGEATYARKALGKVRQTLATTFSANFIRDLFAESVWIYDWIYPALTPAERDELIAGFNRMATYAVGDDPTHRGMRTEDSDETTGYYFGLVFVDLATGPENPLAGRWTTGEIHNPFRLPVGGLDVTGPGRTTARNAIADFIRISAGGDWLESAQYNPETLAYLWMGIEGVKTATGVDHFPEATALSRQVAAAMAAQVTSDLTQRIQWGDDEHPRDFRSRMFRFTTQLGMVAGLNQDNPEGQAAQGLLLDLAAKYGWTGYLSAEPWSRLFPFYNPYAARGTWAARPSAHYASGMGHLAVRQGASLFSAFAGTRTGADHGIEYMGDFQLYRNGEWAVTHPLGYGTAALAVGTVNSVALAGLNAMATRGPVVEQHGADWWALSMSTSGSYYWPGYYDPPPAFVTQWQRGLVYFQEGGADVIVIRDSLVTANPMALPKLARYYPTDQAKITAANGLAEWQIHALTRPTITGSRVEWTTPGGQPVRVYTLAPGDAVQTIIDEKTQWPTVPIIEITDPERHFQVKLRAPSHRPIEQFLNVVVVGDPSLAPVAVPGGVKVGSTTVQFTPTGVVVTR